MTPPRQPSPRFAGPVSQIVRRAVRAAPRHWLTALILLSSGALVALVLAYPHAQALAEGSRLTASIAKVTEEQTIRLLQTVDQRLQLAAVDLAQLDSAGGLNVASARVLLRRNLESLPFVRAMWVMDNQGRITQDSDEGNIGVKLADRAYFQHHLAQPQSQFFIGVPVRSRTTGTWLVSASRPLKTADGRFAGIIVAALEPPYLDALWRTIDLGPEGSIALFRRDGVLLARSPHDDASMGKSFSDTPLFKQFLATRPAGNYQRTSAIDGVLREFSYRTLSTQPDLVVVVGQSHAQMLGQWRQIAWLVLAIWLLSALVLVTLGLRVSRAQRALQRSERALRQSEQNLAVTLQSIGDAVIATDVAGLVTRMNPTAERLTGWPLADALGRPLAEVFRIVGAQTRLPAASPVQLVMDSAKVVGLANGTALLARDGHEYQIADSAAPIRDAANHMIGVVLVFSDVSEKYQTEQALRASEQRFRDTFRLMPAALTLQTAEGVVIDCSDNFCTTTGYAREEVVGRNALELNLWAEAARRVMLRETLLRDGQADDFEFTLQQRGGNTTAMQMSARYLTIGGERLLLSFAHDVSQRRQAEFANQESALQLRLVIRGGDIGFWDWNLPSGRLVVNERWCTMLGLDPHVLALDLDSWNARVHPDDAPRLVKTFEGVILDPAGSGGEVEIRARHSAGHYVWILDRFSVVSRAADGTPLRAVGTHLDITERKQAELALQAALKEKTALLNEVHHRVKNNLQVVTSLLRLERRRSTHAPTQAVLSNMEGRIRAMALLHESIYRAGTFEAVDLGAYAREIATQAFASLRTGTDTLRLRLDLSPVQVGLDQATTCGLLLTELISNALKHGFAEGGSGEIRIVLQRVVAQPPEATVDPGVVAPRAGSAIDQWCLSVSDTGVGLPANFAARQQESLGLQLVHSLASQLGGTMVVGPGDAATGSANTGSANTGASFGVTFAVIPPATLVIEM